MKDRNFNALIGISCSLNIMSAGITLEFGQMWGSLVLLLGTIVGCLTAGYQWGYLKAMKRGRN